jgi:hypothetical protein
MKQAVIFYSWAITWNWINETIVMFAINSVRHRDFHSALCSVPSCFCGKKYLRNGDTEFTVWIYGEKVKAFE